MTERIDVRARLRAVTLPDEAALSTNQLAALLSIDFETVHRAVHRGELPPPVRRTKYRYVFESESLRAAQQGLPT